VVELQSPLVTDALRPFGDRPGVGASEHHFTRFRADPGAVQDLDEWNAGPFRRAHSAQVPLFTRDRRVESRATVPRTLEGDDQRLRGHVLKVVQAQAQRALDEAPYVEPPRGCIQHRNLKVVAD